MVMGYTLTMITVAKAESIVSNHVRSFGTEQIALESATNRVLAESVQSDRDMPPYNRATMDGIALRFEDFLAGKHEFQIMAVQAAGQPPIKNLEAGCCVQIMTGAAVPDSADTIVPIEDIRISNKTAVLFSNDVIKGQFIHQKGVDKLKDETMLSPGQTLTPAAVSVAATMGKKTVAVSKPPRVVVISTGNELVDISRKPNNYQIRQSNNYAIQAAFTQYAVEVDMLHLADSKAELRRGLEHCVKSYDLLIVSGGVSKGEFDYIPEILSELSVEALFHGVEQRPGKPFWFGVRNNGPTVFALPGNPVSTFLCLYKYVLPWLRDSLGMLKHPTQYAVLSKDVSFDAHLHYFQQVQLRTNSDGLFRAIPIVHNGSGDFVSLLKTDAFLELPASRKVFKKGEAYKVLAVRSII